MCIHIALNPKILLIVIGLIVVFPLLRPAGVFASNSQAENSIFSHIPNAAKVTNCEYDNTTGILVALLDTGQKITAVNTDIGETTYTTYTCIKTLSASGIPTSQVYEMLGIDPTQDGGGIGAALMLTNANLLQARPASGIIFALDQFDKITSPGQVYAAEPQSYFPGTGYDLLTPIQSFWGWAATMSFSFMTLIIIVVAFAMIFRARLGGKQVVQIQNAIPGIVLAMVLIPLSYPISGLFIDAITLSTNVFHDFIFGAAGPGAVVYNVGPSGSESTAGETAFNADGTRGLYGDDWRVSSLRIREQFGAIPIATNVAKSFCTTAASQSQQATCDKINVGQFSFIDSVVSAFQNNSGLAMLIGNILNLLFGLIAIVISIKITWRLLKKYVMMIFLPITSPFIFATVAIPGRGTQMMFDYFKQMANCALHFIVTYCLFLVVIVFANPAYQNTISGAAGIQGYRPPVLAGWLTSIITPQGGVSGSVIFTILALGLFLSIPSILDSIDKQLASAPLPFVKNALNELRSSSDIAFRQAPAVLSTGVRNVAGGVRSGVGAGARVYDSYFRKPGEATSAERAQAGAAADLAAREAALADAQASGSIRRIAVAQARLAASQRANSALGRTPPGEGKMSLAVTYEALSKEVSAIPLSNALLNQPVIANIKINLKSNREKAPLPHKNVVYGPESGGAFAGTPSPLVAGDAIFVYKLGGTEVARLTWDGGKTQPEGTSDKLTLNCTLRFTDVAAIRAMNRGDEIDTDAKMFDIGGARTKGGIKLKLTRSVTNV